MTIKKSKSKFEEFKPDKSFFQSIALIPVFALVGLGADGLSSSCYGPEEAFKALGNYQHLILLVALLSSLTIWALSASYCQIIEKFPRGGGGYLVASKLLSPMLGLISGCALLVDYVLTITISVASGVDAVFSVFPAEHIHLREPAKILSVIGLTLLNLRGIKESVFPWVPIFVLFVVTHAFAFVWGFFHHGDELVSVAQTTMVQAGEVSESLGMWGLMVLLLKSYSMGAGTYTGIEAVSNGMSIIKEPKVPNAKRTMVYIALSLGLTVLGLVICYLLYHVQPQENQTLNAVLMGQIGNEMGTHIGPVFKSVTIFSEMALLFVAAETGFLGGPQILANMAVDRWFPHKFMTLSDRFVMRHGLIMMGGAASLVMLYTSGSVDILVVLYSLSVFITFTLSQTGMVLYWWRNRHLNPKWLKRFLVNGFGVLLTIFILISLTIIKFAEGAWLTLLVVGLLFTLGICIKRYYQNFTHVLSKFHRTIPARLPTFYVPPNPQDMQTAVLLVSGIHGLAQHSIANVIQFFGDSVHHFVFLHIGLIDTESFKGEEEILALKDQMNHEVQKVVKTMKEKGYSAEGKISIGVDIADEIEKLAVDVSEKYPHCIFYGGQLVLPRDTFITRYLHNQTLYAIQRRLLDMQLPLIIVPVYLKYKDEKTMSFVSLITRKK